MGRGCLGSEDQGRHAGHFPHSLGPWKACWVPRPGTLPFEATSSCRGPRDVGGKEEGGKGGEVVGGTLQGQGIRGSTAGISPTHSGPVSLLGSWTWSSTLQGQKH